jgi:hypothetical protein
LCLEEARRGTNIDMEMTLMK